MLTGLLKVIDDEGMEAVHRAALRVLERTGLTLRGDFLLRALADAGCRVDFAAQRAWFLPELVERQVAAQRDRYRLVRSSLWYPFCESLPVDGVAWPSDFTVDYGFTTPAIYEYPEGRYRPPTTEDQVEMIRLGQVLTPVRAVCSPFVCADFDPCLEPLESAGLLLLHSDKPGWVGVGDPRQVRFLAELAGLATEALGSAARASAFRTAPPMFAHAYCTTSPLKLDTSACQVLQEALRYGFPVNFAPMPILGGTTPVTPAGSMVVATAEILGCLTACSLVAPEVYYYATSITGEMDMRTTQVCYATPAAVLTDAALHQLFRRRYGLVLNVEPAYVEAKCPGIQAAFMKTFRQMAFAATVSAPLGIGLLDNGAAFSPVQAMIDLELNRALHRWGQGISVDEESLAVDSIEALGFCEHEAHIGTEHTLHHFQEVLWDPRLFDRTYRRDESYRAEEADRQLLDRADEQWRALVKAQPPLERDAAFCSELERILTAARTELLG
jgi:trimethylamine--corrinoid protein Co-methyltransferase